MRRASPVSAVFSRIWTTVTPPWIDCGRVVKLHLTRFGDEQLNAHFFERLEVILIMRWREIGEKVSYTRIYLPFQEVVDPSR